MSGMTPYSPCAPPEPTRKPGYYLVENQHRAVVGGHTTQALEEAWRGRHHAHVAGHRLDDDPGYRIGVAVEQCLYGIQVVEIGHQCFRWRRTPVPRRWWGCRGSARPNRPAPAGRRRGRGKLPANLIILSRPVKARARRMALMHASVPELTSRSDSMLGRAPMMSRASSTSFSTGAPKLAPPLAARSQDGYDRRVGMAQHQRPPGAEVINVFVAVHVNHTGAAARRDEGRRSADGAEGADGAVDATGHQALGFGKQGFRLGELHHRHLPIAIIAFCLRERLISSLSLRGRVRVGAYPWLLRSDGYS